MSNQYSLDDLRDDMDKEFAPLVLEVGDVKITLKNLMRLPKEDRKRVMTKLTEIDELDLDGDDNEDASPEDIEVLSDAVFTILKNVAGEGGDALLEGLGDDFMFAMKIVALWKEATQPGEAEPSQTS